VAGALALAVLLVPAVSVEPMKREREITRAVERIRPILAGQPPEIQGAVLADLLAIWLAGHHVAGDERATQALRAEMLAAHLQGVAELVPVNAKIMGVPI
jgi:hypothetical protein